MRLLRSDPDGGFHHVMNRSARRFDCFLDDRDRMFFLSLLGEACEEFGVEAFSYVLMGNHFHLGLHCRQGGLSATMKHISENYTRAFNRFHSFDGPLFRGRFTSVPIRDDRQLAAVSRYISRNPLELGIRIDRYPWSSYRDMIGERTPPGWLNPNLVLSVGSGQAGYRRFVETDLESDKTSIADGRFNLPDQPALAPVGSLTAIDDAICQISGRPMSSLRRGERGVPNVARSVASLIAYDLRTFPPEAVARHYGYSSKSALRVAVNRARQQAAGDSDQHSSLRRQALDSLGMKM